MIDFQAIPTGELEQLFIIANTPEFLHRRFIQLASVRLLADQNQAAELVAEIRHIVALEQPAISDIVKAYACACALNFSVSTDFVRELAALPTENFRWLPRLLKLSGMRVQLTTFSTVDVHQRPIITSTPADGKASASFSGFHLPLAITRLSESDLPSKTFVNTAEKKIVID